MSEGKPAITRAQDKKPEPKKLSRTEKWRLSLNDRKKKKEAEQKAKASREAKKQDSYLNAIDSKVVSTETKQRPIPKQTSSTKKTSQKPKNKNMRSIQSIPSISLKQMAIGAGVLVIVLVFGVWVSNKGSGTTDVAATLGDSSEVVSGELPEEAPEFSLLYPSGTDPSNYEVRKTSPPGAESTFTYLDRFESEGAIFQVTQQQKPETFDIVKVATDFQATNIIQVDDTTIYHGRNEGDNVQSLIFLKNGLIVSIRSPQVYEDDIWAAYIVSLQ